MGSLPGDTHLGLRYKYVQPQSVWFLRRFGFKNGYRLYLFWSEFGYGFGGNTGVHERVCCFNFK